MKRIILLLLWNDSDFRNFDSNIVRTADIITRSLDGIQARGPSSSQQPLLLVKARSFMETMKTSLRNLSARYAAANGRHRDSVGFSSPAGLVNHGNCLELSVLHRSRLARHIPSGREAIFNRRGSLQAIDLNREKAGPDEKRHCDTCVLCGSIRQSYLGPISTCR
jgi:hypothetical protein